MGRYNKEHGFEADCDVIYGDTDSVMVNFKVQPPGVLTKGSGLRATTRVQGSGPSGHRPIMIQPATSIPSAPAACGSPGLVRSSGSSAHSAAADVATLRDRS